MFGYTCGDCSIKVVCSTRGITGNLDENTVGLKGERMRCEEAGEFVSAICDGESIPASAAEHVGQCEICRCRLKEYSEIGAELRLVASLESSRRPEVRQWRKEQRVRSN